MQVEAPQPALEPAEGERAPLGFALGERDALDLAVQRGAEADLVEAVRDLLHGARDAGAALRLQPDDEDVARFALVDERAQWRIRGEAAIPVRRVADRHRLVERRQAGRGEERLQRDLARAED